MDSNDGGLSSSSQLETAAEIARKKVLAAYSSAVENLKKTSTLSGNAYSSNHNNQYIAPPVPRQFAQQNDALDFEDDNDLVENDYEHVNSRASEYQATQSSLQNNSNYQASTESNMLKDAPINQAAVNEEWKQYHSAWQNYYQNYYSDYYAKAAQNYLATEKLKNERVASGRVQQKRRAKRLFPVFILLTIAVVFAFLQYNRLIFAPIMAYVSPNADTVATHIEAVDPNIIQTVSPEPRLIIPKLNIDVPVAFAIPLADVNEAMNHGVAQFSIPGANALPGQVGNLVLSGHSAGDIYSSNPYKFIFSGLERLEVGDLIYINYETVRYTYQMTKSEVVEPTDVAALIYDTQKPMLTLITCTPLGTSRYRLLITAEQISPAFEYNEGGNDTDPGDYTPPEGDEGTSMPANEPSFFENLWSGIFGS